jgi:hypothetical protein
MRNRKRDGLGNTGVDDTDARFGALSAFVSWDGQRLIVISVAPLAIGVLTALAPASPTGEAGHSAAIGFSGGALRSSPSSRVSRSVVAADR